MKTLLWLDDYRNPHENNWLSFSPIEQPFSVVWVKNYNQFCDYIDKNGVPDAICFDHDLSDVQSAASATKQRLPEDEKTGLNCARYLIGYCAENGLPLPKWNIQSANPVGKENIASLLKQYEKFARP